MKTNSFFLAVLLAASFGITSCSKEDNTASLQKLFLSKTYLNGYLNGEYRYDSDFKLLSLYYYDSLGNVLSHLDYDTNDKGQIIKTSYFDAENRLHYYYSDEFNSEGLMSRSSYFRLQSGTTDPERVSSTEYEYNTKRRCIKILYLNGSDNMQYYRTLEYTGTNATKYYFYTPQDSLVGFIDMTYDTKKIPYLPLTDIGTSENNPVRLSSPSEDANGKITLRFAANSVISVWAYKVEYEYDNSGYPTKKTITYEDGFSVSYEMEYIIKK